MYKGIEYSNAGSLPVSVDVRFSKYKISHLIFRIHGVAIKATESPKLILNAFVSGANNLVKNIITNVPLSVMGEYCNILKGVSWNSTTDLYMVIPVGSLDLTNMDLNVSVKSSSDLDANALTMDIYAARYSDNDPVVEYQYRSIPTDAIALSSVKQIYDVATAYNSSVISKLYFDNMSELTVPHKIAFTVCQQIGAVESENAFGLVFSEKTEPTGRKLRIEPTVAFNALIVQHSNALNG